MKWQIILAILLQAMVRAFRRRPRKPTESADSAPARKADGSDDGKL